MSTSTSTDSALFEKLVQSQQKGGAEAVLQILADHLREAKRFHELFEALKMQARLRAGLPLLYADTPDDMTDAQRDRLEEGLLAACREVGTLLMQNGFVREGWMYLRPVGDRGLALQVLQSVPTEETNIEELIEVSLHEGVDVERGFRLVLENYGTCNSITTYESLITQRPKPDRQIAAGLLVERLHRELSQSLRTDIARHEGQEPKETTIAGLVSDRDWLFGEFAYHIDTTHLASTIRFARVLEDRRLLELALDMTEYGRRLSSQFQYRGEEPFSDIYQSHAIFLSALLGKDVDTGVRYFGDKARSIDATEHGTVAIETYVDLLVRVGRQRQALQEALELLPARSQSCGIAPSLLELSEMVGDYGPLREYCRQHENVLGFATALLNAKTK